MAVYPSGYGKAMISLDEMKRRHAGKMHPEYARRFFAWIEAQGGQIGVGGGWRKTPSDTSGASRAGRSFHQDQRFDDGKVWYCAVDLVHVDPGRIHRSPTWSEVPKQGTAEAEKWGLHCNVSGEPWHIQPIEIDGHQSWVRGGRIQPRAGYQLPADAPEVVVKAAVDSDDAFFAPEQGRYGLFPVDDKKPLLAIGEPVDNSDFVRYLQAVMRNQTSQTIEIDGEYGPRTAECVESVQRWNGLEEDGRCGRNTWAAVDTYATR